MQVVVLLAGVVDPKWRLTSLAEPTLPRRLSPFDEAALEAAQLDGAGAWGSFRHVIAPAIAPVLALVTLLEIIWDIRVFTQFHVLQQNGGITQQTNVLGTFIYQVGLSGGNYGLASAAAMLMLALTVALSARYISMLLRDRS